MNTLDQNKAEVVYQQLKDINPDAEIIYDKVGISDESSANKFIHDADMIIDEMDFGMFKQSIRLQRRPGNRINTTFQQRDRLRRIDCHL